MYNLTKNEITILLQLIELERMVSISKNKQKIYCNIQHKLCIAYNEKLKGDNNNE